ncbi:MAG: hypothetical protein WBP63_05240, partial [Silvibacterium sp.]
SSTRAFGDPYFSSGATASAKSRDEGTVVSGSHVWCMRFQQTLKIEPEECPGVHNHRKLPTVRIRRYPVFFAGQV